jgi:hypothetical protein
MDRSQLGSRVKASSIMEVVISMVIILVVFGIAMMIYTNVSRFSLSAKKISAQALLQEILLNAEHNPGNTTRSLTTADFRVEQEVSPYPIGSNLSVIHLSAYDQNQQKVAELKKVIQNQP